MPHWPRHKYLGPGTNSFKNKPIDQDDAIAREHDIAYTRTRSHKDVFEADKKARNEFFTDFVENKNLHSLVGGLGLGAKNILEEKVLGKSIYGMAPPKRQRTQDRTQDKDSGNDSPSILSPQDNALPISSDEEMGQRWGSTEDSEMYAPPLQYSDPTQAVPLGLGGGSGGGSGVGGSQSGLRDIFNGAPQPNNTNSYTYSKSYHFTMTNSLPSWRRLNVTDLGDIQYYQQRFGNIHGIPWEYLFMYMSEGEIERFFANHTMGRVKSVKCEVYSLGVRLPFITSATTATVANANAQYPIGCFHFDSEYKTNYDSAQVLDIMNKCIC